MKNIKRLTLAVCAVLLACLLCVCAVAEVAPEQPVPTESVAPVAEVAEEESTPVPAEEPSQAPSEESTATEEPVVTEEPATTTEEPVVEPFSKGYVLAKEGLVLYADAALTEKAGELESDAVLYIDGRMGDILTAFYTVDAELATAYTKADKVEELTEAELAEYLDWCKKNEIEVFFDVAAKTLPLMDVTFVVEQPVVEEPVVEEPVVEEPVEDLPAEDLVEDLPAEDLVEDLPSEELIEDEPVEGALAFDAETLTYTSESGEVIAYIDAEGNLIDAATGLVLAKVDLELGVIYIPEAAAETEIPQE